MSRHTILARHIRTMLPSYFAMVMATGIIGVAFSLLGWSWLGKAFLLINVTFFLVIFTSFVYRLIHYSRSVIDDFRSYERGPSFLTLVAACCILGNQFILTYQCFAIAKILLCLAVFLWLFLGYGFFFNITVTENKKNLKDGINGGWLLIVVAIQAIAVLTSLLASGNQLLLFFATCLFLLGALFYLYIMSLIIYRMSFIPLHAEELGAPYWINMGATAITTLSGSMLILMEKDLFLLAEISSFLKGLTLLFWAAGSWWIPLLILLGIWKHGVKGIKVPLSAAGYDPSYWSLVFPLGMYTVCTFRLAEALKLSFLDSIPLYFIFIALFAWICVMIGFMHTIYVQFHQVTVKNQTEEP